MLATMKQIENHQETVDRIIGNARENIRDMDPYLAMDLFRFYNYIRALPYLRDPKGVETISRPAYVLSGDWQGPDGFAPCCRDCDDKTLAMISFCFAKNIPVRIVVAGQFPGVAHHIYPEVNLSGKWIPADPTYPDRNSFAKKLYDEERFRRIYPV